MLRSVFLSFFVFFLHVAPLQLLALPGLPGLSAATPNPSPKQGATEKSIPDQLQDAQRSIGEAQDTLTRMQSAETVNALAAAGLPATLQSELTIAAGNGLRNFQRYAENLKTLARFQKNEEARKALAETDTETDPPEISLIRDRLNSTKQTLSSATNELKMLSDSTQEAANLLPKLEQAIRQFPENPTDADHWQLTLAKLQKTEAESTVLANVVRKKVLILRITTLQQDAIADKKLLQADATSAQPEQRTEALARLDKERLKINRQLQEANKRDRIAQIALDKTRETYLKKRNTAGNADLVPERQQYDLAQAEAETAEEIIESSRIFLQILDTETTHWKYIAKLKSGISAEEGRKGADALNHQLELIRKWKPQLEQEVRSKQIAMEGLKRRLADKLPESDNNFLNNKLKLLQEQISIQQHLLWRVETLNWRLLNWVEQLKQMAPPRALRNEFKQIWSNVYSALWGAIHYEVFHFKDTEMIGGNQVVIAERSVTVARIVLALLLFLLGYKFLIKLAKFIIRSVQVRFEIPIARTTLLEKFLFYIMTIFLVLFALSWARIPLTIFAYLGGALAIGIGFGAQNLINNFISGIIVLFERQINVGDIVEVDGNVGEVIKLGNRCSRMRRADGVEMLVPNSLLLEKNVVNWTLSDLDHRFEFTFSVVYETAVEKVTQLVKQAFSETPHILSQPIPCIFFEKFGDSGLIFGVYYWVKLYKGLDARQIGSNLRTRINQLFKDEDIQMPFPQHEVHLDAPLRVQIESNMSS